MNTTPSKQDIDFIRQELIKFNSECVGDDGHTPINIIEHNKDGHIIGGVLGGTY